MRQRAYAKRSMIGAQFFSAIKPLSFFLHFSTAAWYSLLTAGYFFTIATNDLKLRSRKVGLNNVIQVEEAESDPRV